MCSGGAKYISAHGHNIPELLEAIMKFFPLDTYNYSKDYYYTNIWGMYGNFYFPVFYTPHVMYHYNIRVTIFFFIDPVLVMDLVNRDKNAGMEVIKSISNLFNILDVCIIYVFNMFYYSSFKLDRVSSTVDL